jgi:hypothetical protein
MKTLYKCPGFSWIDIHGRPLENTPNLCPYSHDPYVHWRGGSNDEVYSSVYDDNLRHHLGWTKWIELCQKHFGDNGGDLHWKRRNPEDIQAFLREALDVPELRLIIIVKHKNMATGYDVWRFCYGR